MTSPFDSGTSGISIALDVPFPANVSSGAGVTVDKTTGDWVVGLDYPPLVDGGTPANPSAIYLAGYDSGLGLYEKLRLDRVISGATGLDSRTVRGDADYSILTTDRYVALATALTVNRTWTLPAAASVPGGREITLQDECGGLAPTHYLNLALTGADKLDGRTGTTAISMPYSGVKLRSDGLANWSVAAQSAVTPVVNANYTCNTDDRVVAVSGLTAPRLVTLPSAAAYAPGRRLTVYDQDGSCSATNTITIARAGSDTINGTAAPPIAALQAAFAYIGLVSDGTSKWTVVDGGNAGTTTVTAAGITDASTLGRQLLTQTTAALDRTSLGSTAVGDAVFIATSATAARAALGAGTVGDAVFTAASPRLIRGFDVATNLQINASVASNNLTVALKGEDGSDPSATNPIYIPFRDATLANGDLTWLTITAPMSITVPGGGTPGAVMGATSGVPFRLWLVCFNDAGTLRLGLINCLSGAGSIYPLRAKMQDTVSSTLISGTATSAQIFYTAGAGVTSKSYSILGYLTYEAGLTTAGTYNVPPTKVQLFGPGVQAPGEPTGNAAWINNGSGSSTTSTSLVDVTGSSITLTLTSAANLVKYNYTWNGFVGLVAATNTTYTAQLMRGAGFIWGAQNIQAASAGGAGLQTQAGMAAAGMDFPQTAVNIYKLQHKTSSASATAITSSIGAIVEEIMA